MPNNAGAPAVNKILYVDDEPGLLEIGKLFLEDQGSFTVDTSLSAHEALELLVSRQYDAIVSDFEMPRMNGIAFLKTLRARGDTTPFIIFTGRGREDVVIEALNSGADYYLQKGGDPVSQFAELEHKILRAISQKQADLALKKSEHDYRHLIEHASEAIFVIQDEVFRLVNPQAARLSGYPEQELINQQFTRFVHPDDSEQLIRYFRMRSTGSQVPSHYTFRIIHKDQTIRWVELSVVAITWNGSPAILNFLTDITDRKRAEDALRASEQNYRHLIEHAGEAIFVTQDEVFRLVNPQLVRFSGYSEQELLNQPFTRFVHPDNANALLDNYRKRIAGSSLPSQYTFRIVCKDGTIRWVELSVVFITWDERPAILNFLTDITDRKLAEDALRESEERYRQFFRTTLDGLFITTTDGQWIDFNDAIVEMFGCSSREEVFGTPIRSLYVNPGDRAAIVSRVEQEGYIKEYPLSYRRRDGAIFSALMTVIAQKNPDGSTRMFIGTIRDITERKRTEDALRESEECYRQFFRTTLDGLFITTTDGQWIDFNNAIVEMFGCRSREEIFGKSIISLYVDPEDRAAFLERVRTEGYVKEYPVRLKKQDGTAIDTLMTVALQKNPEGSAKALIGTIRDVTEKNRTGQALRESEVRYRRIFESFEDLYYQTDAHGILTILSPSLYSLTGWTGDELIGRPITEIYVNPEDRQVLLEELSRNGRVRDYEVLLRKRDGTKTSVSVSANHIFDADGSPAGVAGIIRDISRRKQVEDSLRESEAKFRSLVNNALEAILIFDIGGTILFANEALVRMIDAGSSTDLTGKNVMDFIASESRECVVKDLEKVARGQDAFFASYHLISLKGRDVFVESIGKIITYEGKTADFVFLRNMTGQK